MCRRCYDRASLLLEQVVVEQETRSTQSSSSASASQSQEVDYVRGMILEAGSVDNAIIGPTFPDVAEKVDSQAGAEPAQPEREQKYNDSFEDIMQPPSYQIPGTSTQDISGDLFADEDKSDLQSQSESSTLSESQPEQKQDEEYQPPSQERKSEAIQELNSMLNVFDSSPLNKRKLQQINYGKEKIRKVEETLKDKLVAAGAPTFPENFEHDAFTKTLSALKEKFKASNTLKEKIGVLSIALISLSQRQVLSEFEELGATLYMIKQTGKLVKDQGILPNPAPKKGKRLSQETVDNILKFYEDDQYSSKQMPGKKDYISVRVGDRKILVQKRLITCTLKELYATYKEQFPTVKVGFSKFASLRPKHCVLADSAGTHSVCVCKYHQNFKLLIDAGNFKQYGLQCETYYDFISLVICEEPTPSCYLNSCCDKCPGTENLRIRLLTLFDDNLVESIKYKQWTSTERCKLETLLKNSEEFVELFTDQLKELLPHHYVSKQQAKYYSTLKTNLKEGEVLVVCDFAENYTFIVQDSVQNYYWNQDQVTIHPFVSYYKLNGELKHVSLAVISDHLKHDINAVYAFEKNHINFLKSKIPNLRKVFYFSDGAAQQYKNKYNVLNLNLHEEDFGVPAEWHYFATSHGKGPCDGLAGTLKRNAYLASIRNTAIRNPIEFYQWAKEKMVNVNVSFIASEDVKQISQDLEKRFALAMSVPQMRKQHSVVPHSRGMVLTRPYSFADTGTVVPVELVRKIPPLSDLQPGDFVALNLESGWTVGEIQLIDEDEILVSCFEKTAGNKFLPTETNQELPFSANEILTVVTATFDGTVYQLKPDDIITVNWQLAVIKSELKRQQMQHR
ncbi:Latrophilin Cirl [Frankliniella fusca]|uniref:Latrophilin Cirl n=1 Tax=Frankliniella fusca TaxID=407009 RepID=A0AAE1LD56_9NEOP|nr:Latrophilin Cirl [Frankliniella fusca]